MMRVNVCWTLRISAVSSGPSSTSSGSSETLRDEVGLLAHPLVDLHALAGLDEDPQQPSGTLSMRATTPATPTVCSSSGPGVSRSGSLRAQHHQHAVAGQDVVDELDRAVLADRQRRQRVRVGDRVAQRQDRAACPGGRRELVVVRGAHRSVPRIGTVRGRAGRLQRQLDGQDPVLVGGVGGVGVDLGAERDDAPERPALDLELLVDAVVGALGLAVAGEHELAAA